MFQLVVAVISIALIAFLALTSLYYGGDAFQSSSLRAGVTTLINAGQQIAGAAVIYKTDTGGVAAATVGDLVTGIDGMTYLSSAPGGSALTGDSAWVIEGDVVAIAITAPAGSVADICTEVARQAGNSGVFACDSDGANFLYKLTGPALEQPVLGGPAPEAPQVVG